MFDSRTVQVIFVVIDHEILSTVGHSHCTTALACTEVICSLLKGRQVVLIKLFDSLSMNDAVAELW
jgi:hypothetical protein